MASYFLGKSLLPPQIILSSYGHAQKDKIVRNFYDSNLIWALTTVRGWVAEDLAST